MTNQPQHTDNTVRQKTLVLAINRILGMFDKDDPVTHKQFRIIVNALETLYEHLDQPK